MSTHDLKLSACQSGEISSASNQERFYTHTEKTRFQDVSGHEKFYPGSTAQHNHTKGEPDSRTIASAPSLGLTGQEKSSKDLPIRQVILLRSKRDSSRTSEDQGESSTFTTFISIILPGKRNNKDTTEDNEETLLNETDLDSTTETVKKTANEHHAELTGAFPPTEACSKSTGDIFKEGDGPKALFKEDGFTTLQNQHGINITNQGRNKGIQDNTGLHKQIVHSDLLRHSSQPDCTTQTEVNKGTNANKESGANDLLRENAPITLQGHSNLTLPEEDSSLKASTDCQVFQNHHSDVLSQVISLASFHEPHSGSTLEPELSFINPASAMLASTLVSVLAPPWNGRLRRFKQVNSEVEHEPPTQDCGQNNNPSTLLRQDHRQKSYIASQRQPAEHVLQEPNDNYMQITASTSYNCPDWQKENNSPNVTTTVFSHLDTGQVPKSSQSEERRGYRISKTGDQNEPFKSLSSKPTTSSLLLALRSNLRKSNAEPTQRQSPITRPVRSLELPSRSILTNTQLYTPSITIDDQSKKTLVSYPFQDTPSRAEGTDTSRLSSPPISNEMVASRSKTPETELLKKPEASVSTAEEGQFLHSTESSRPGTPKALQNCATSQSIYLRKYSSTEDRDAVDWSTTNKAKLQNSNINIQQATHNPDHTISPKEKRSFTFDFPQTDLIVRNLKSQSTHSISKSNSLGTRTFTDSLNFSPRKESSSVDGINITHRGQNYLETSKKHSQSSQSSTDLSSPYSPWRPLRKIYIPSIYSYLRESSSSISSPNSPSTLSSRLQRVESSSSSMQDESLIPKGDVEILPSRFSFDFMQYDSQVQPLKRGSYSFSAPKSLPPDFGRRSVPRLSTSPYSALISSRPTLGGTLQELVSPPASKPHDRSRSYHSVTLRNDPSPSPSIDTCLTKRPKERVRSPDREQRAARVVQAYSCVLDNHRPAQPCLPQTAPDASFVMESLSPNITPHPREQNTGSSNIPQQEHDGLSVLQLDGDNVYPNQNPKENNLLSNRLTPESETPPIDEKETIALHERLQENQCTNAKKGLFALRAKKDNGFSSASMTVMTPHDFKTKRNSPVFKTNSRIDQMLNRLKLTFGVKRSDNTYDTPTKKSKTHYYPLDTVSLERANREEKKCSVDQWEDSNSSFNSDKPSFSSLGSLSPVRKFENTLLVGGQNKNKEEKNCSGIQWESSNSSLTIDRASSPALESLAPLTSMQYENKLNVDWQNKNKDGKTCSGIQWGSSNSSLTIDRASSPALESLAPLTSTQYENKLNVDWQNKNKDGKTCSGIQWGSSNSSLTIDRASSPALESLATLTSTQYENKLNVDWQNKSNDGKTYTGIQWGSSNSSLTSDKPSFPSLESLSPLTYRKSENTVNVDWRKRYRVENKNQSYSRSLSPHRLQTHGMSHSATLLHDRKPSGPPSPFCLFEFDSEDIENDNVFYSPVSKKTNSLCEYDNLPQLSSTKYTVQQNLTEGHSSSAPCANLKYGLDRGRSFSVNSVVSSRPSGPGRISTSSVSDLSSLEDLTSRGNYTTFDSPSYSCYSSSYGSKSVNSNQFQPGCTLSDDQPFNADKRGISPCSCDDACPTPPPSPPFSPSSRRISKGPSTSPSPIRTLDNLSPRGLLPSKNYKTSLTVFEESSSDTTTDDEYYLDYGDEVETEL